MNIVHIITRLIVGGAQENTLLTCRGLHNRGHKVTLITGPSPGPEGQLLQHTDPDSFNVIQVNSLKREIAPLSDLLCNNHLKRLIKKLNPDIVHTHSAKAGILGRRAAFAVKQQSTNAACCGIAARVEKQRTAQTALPKIIHTIHGWSFHPYQSNWKNRLYIALERKAARVSDLLITVAQAMTDQGLAAGIGTPDQYVKIFAGIHLPTFIDEPSPEKTKALRAELNIPTGALLITTIARLFELKGHSFIIEAAQQLAAKHKNIYWLFVGDGSLRPEIEKQIAGAKLQDRFRLTGLVPPDHIGKYLHASDILVHCSLREGLARALPQALLCHVPVVAFDLDGAREVVLHNKTGLLTEPKNIPQLTAALEQLIQNPDLRKSLAQAGNNHCRNLFDQNTMVDKIEKLYQSIL